MKYLAGYIKDSKFYKIVAGLPLPFFFYQKSSRFYLLIIDIIWKSYER